MNESFFIHTHQNTWEKLENTLKHLRSKKKTILEQDRLHHLLYLYQTVSGHLSIARTRYGATDTVEYLNSLVSRAHQVIYVSRPNNLSRIIRFFLHGFPKLIKKEALILLLSSGIFVSSFLFSFFFTLYHEDYALSFVPAEYVQSLKGDAAESDPYFNSSITSVAIFTNNIRVGIVAFALGITFGIGTVYVLVQNGLLLGALSAVAVHSGAGYLFWSLILPHGIPELFCVFVCGAAGLLIARSMIFPGILSRRHSFTNGGRKALFLLIGTLPLFILAGLTEGFFTPIPVHPLWKYAVSLLWLVFLLFYILHRPKRK